MPSRPQFSRPSRLWAVAVALLCLVAGLSGCRKPAEAIDTEKYGVLPDTRTVYCVDFGGLVALEVDKDGIFLLATAFNNQGKEALLGLPLMAHNTEDSLAMVVKAMKDRGMSSADGNIRVAVVPLAEGKVLSPDLIEQSIRKLVLTLSLGQAALDRPKTSVKTAQATAGQWSAALADGRFLTEVLWPPDMRHTPAPTATPDPDMTPEMTPEPVEPLNPDAPLLPKNHNITAKNMPDGTTVLSWSMATSEKHKANKLEYCVFYSEGTPIGTPTQVETNGTALSKWTANAQGFVIQDVSKLEGCLVTVVVRDPDGNQSVYSALALNPRDTAPPAVPDAVLAVDNITSFSASLSWRPASDDTTTDEWLEYTVYYSALPLGTMAEIDQNGAAVGSFSGKITYALVSHLAGDMTYYFNVVVADRAGNRAMYAQVQAHTLSTLPEPTPTPTPPPTPEPTLEPTPEPAST